MMRVAETQRHRMSCRIGCIFRLFPISLFVVMAFCAVPAYADSPAVTDFGIETASPAFASVDHPKEALFLTLCSDGTTCAEVHEVHDDSIVGFARNQSAWQSDEGLHWFLQIPVYVREVHVERSPADAI